MDDWETVSTTKPDGGISVANGEGLGISDKPQNGDQRLNNVGKLESYYEGEWIVKET
jgi:hypothetical protein